MSSDNEQFQFEGSLYGPETKRVLQRLEEESVRFELEVDDTEFRGAGRITSLAYGANDGTGIEWRLYVHKSDLERWRKLRQEFYPI